MHGWASQIRIDQQGLDPCLRGDNGQVGGHQRFSFRRNGAGHGKHLKFVGLVHKRNRCTNGAETFRCIGLRMQVGLQITFHQRLAFDVRNVSQEVELEVAFDVVLTLDRIVQVVGKKGEGKAHAQTPDEPQQQGERLARLDGVERLIGQIHHLQVLHHILGIQIHLLGLGQHGSVKLLTLLLFHHQIVVFDLELIQAVHGHLGFVIGDAGSVRPFIGESGLFSKDLQFLPSLLLDLVGQLTDLLLGHDDRRPFFQILHFQRSQLRFGGRKAHTKLLNNRRILNIGQDRQIQSPGICLGLGNEIVHRFHHFDCLSRFVRGLLKAVTCEKEGLAERVLALFQRRHLIVLTKLEHRETGGTHVVGQLIDLVLQPFVGLKSALLLLVQIAREEVLHQFVGDRRSLKG